VADVQNQRRRTVGLLTSVFIVAVNGACDTPHSIAEAVAKRSDEFPRDSYVLVPQADIPRLGQTVILLDARRARATARCFDVAPVVGAGLKKIELSYEAGAEFQAELTEIATKAGAKLQNDDKATIALDDLKVVEGFGVPIRGSACGFTAGKHHAQVITSTVVAGSAKIVFSRNLSFNGHASAGWAAGSANSAGAGNVTQSGQLQGSNIVIVASVTSVDVTLDEKRLDLGTKPTPGTVVTFPSGFDGNVSIDSVNTETTDDRPLLAITAHTMMSASAQNVPATLKACAVNKSTILTPGEGCFVWNQSGASGVNVWFERLTVEGADHIVLHVDGYATTFAPGTVSGLR
jgi:hypothetical protein